MTSTTYEPAAAPESDLRRSGIRVGDLLFRGIAILAALAATGDDEQLDSYLRRGLDGGLSRAQIAEALTHLGFYAGWAKAMKAMTVVARTFGK